ncbi:MAG: DUF2232 domain-containing protein [Bacteriovoracaceae bacterium]
MSADVMPNPQLSFGRLALLGLSSVVLSASFIMSIFAPFPIALAVIMYGRLRGYAIGALGAMVCFVLASLLFKDLVLFGFYLCVLLFGFGIAEIVQRGIRPVRGLVIFGLLFLTVISSLGGFFLKSQNLSAEQYIVQQIEQSSDKLEEQKKLIKQSESTDIEALTLLDNPKLLAKELIKTFPGYIFIAMFIMLWFNMFMVLKSRRLLFAGNDYPHSEHDLLRFQVPFAWISLLVVGLVLATWGQDLGQLWYEDAGMNIIKCLGLFYFFQGFGVLSDFLSFLGIVGFWRSLLVMSIIFLGSTVVAMAGLLDNWFEFRKYFVKKTKID